MQTGNSEVTMCQCEGHATGLQVSTCGLGGAEPSHGHEDKHCAHKLWWAEKMPPAGAEEHVWSPLLLYISLKHCCWAEGTFYLSFVILVSSEVCGVFPYSLIATTEATWGLLKICYETVSYTYSELTCMAAGNADTRASMKWLITLVSHLLLLLKLRI